MNFDRIVQLSYLAQYTSLLDKLRVNSKTHVLDVGSGFGFLKKLVTNKEGMLESNLTPTQLIVRLHYMVVTALSMGSFLTPYQLLNTT